MRFWPLWMTAIRRHRPRPCKRKLEAVDNVASVTFISREEAMQSFISEHPG